MTTKTPDKWIGDLVGTFADPIIVCPGGWEDTLPDWIMQAITMERLIANIATPEMATDAEACAYLYTATLSAPPSADWAEIYLYIAGKTITAHEKREMPEDIKVESLSEYRQGLLNSLKRWIYSRRIKNRPKIKRETKQEKQAILQPAMFDLN